MLHLESELEEISFMFTPVEASNAKHAGRCKLSDSSLRPLSASIVLPKLLEELSLVSAPSPLVGIPIPCQDIATRVTAVQTWDVVLNAFSANRPSSPRQKLPPALTRTTYSQAIFTSSVASVSELSSPDRFCKNFTLPLQRELHPKLWRLEHHVSGKLNNCRIRSSSVPVQTPDSGLFPCPFTISKGGVVVATTICSPSLPTIHHQIRKR